MAPESTPAKTGKLSLYADLLDPSDNSSQPGTISRAPVVFKQASGSESQQDDTTAAKKQQISAASLRFQPTKRPQLSNQKAKAKPTIPKPAPPQAASNTSAPAENTTPPAPGVASKPALANTSVGPAVKSSIADWTANDDDDVNGFYGGEKRQRGGRKKRKKNREPEMHVQNWDDIYDPSRPNSYEDYKHSEEKVKEVRDWKDRLYAHRIAERRSSDIMSDDEDSRPSFNNQFAPPPMNFAPPPNLNDVPPEPPATIPDDPTGEDAYSRRIRLSQNQGSAPADAVPPPPPSPPPMAAQPPSATISRPPVRYELPPPPEEIAMAEAELETATTNEEEPEEDAAPRSNRPGQKGFAERLLAKYGWTKGSGLGANESGIAKPLQVKVEKQKKRPDSEGGGFVVPGGRGKIIGGKRKGDEDEGKFGAMSEVVVLYGMVDGMDLEAELEGGQDGGLMQEIGDECAEKYGRVERVYIDRNSTGSVPIFVKFTSQLSGLRAVNALEGRIFNGNAITARFYDNDKFEKGIYQE